jgi:carboxymethylenebutenolidase
MIELQPDIPTRDGAITTFICHPERDGPHPLIVLYMDAPGVREELRDMARRLASVGYYVMLPNLYYRSGVMELGPLPRDPLAPERKRMVSFMNAIDIPQVMDDTRALLAFADGQAVAKGGPAGCVGYCMSGQYAVNAAATFPDRFAAAASVYGVKLVTDRPDSPHLAARRAQAEFYFACAELDEHIGLDEVKALTEALARASVTAEVEIYPRADHGFAFPQRAAYDKGAAERHWERLFALYRRRLG